MGYPTDEDFRQAHREGWPPGTLMGPPKKKARKPRKAAPMMEALDKSYFAPGAIWGTIAGVVTVIGRSRDKTRPLFTECLIHETGQLVDLHLTDRHSSRSLPGYVGMYTRLPVSLWPKNARCRRIKTEETMEIGIKFTHSKKSKLHHLSPATFIFDESSSTGPVIMKGDSHVERWDLEAGDVIEFSTTKFNDEPTLKIWRGNRLLNGPQPKRVKRNTARKP